MQTLKQLWAKIVAFFRRPPKRIPRPHEHAWLTKALTYASPQRDFTNTTTDPALLEKFVLGVTTMLWECATCHQFNQTEMLGSDRMQIDDILDKAELYGPQYIERGQNTFAIERRQLPNQNPVLGLPIR
jgi:hypothetical protein